MYIFFEAVIVMMCDYVPKSLKGHIFILQIFRSHFGSFYKYIYTHIPFD